MIGKAIKKIKNEMEIKEGNLYIQAIGKKVLKLIENANEIAEKVVCKNKTIEKCCKFIEEKAREKIYKENPIFAGLIGGVAVLSEIEIIEIIKKYYEIQGGNNDDTKSY